MTFLDGHSGAAKRSPEPLNTAGSGQAGTVRDRPEILVFMGSGLSPAASPGMTKGGTP